MQCPDCGYHADDDACFCPKCRYQFRDISGMPVSPDRANAEQPAYDAVPDETLFEARPSGFSGKEMKMLEVQLLQPAVLVVLVISLFVYTVISAVPFAPLSVAGLDFGVTGIISLVVGLLAGAGFYAACRKSLKNFGHR